MVPLLLLPGERRHLAAGDRVVELHVDVPVLRLSLGRRQVALGGRLIGRLVHARFTVVNRSPLPLVCFVRPEADDAFHRAVAAAVCASGEAWLSAPRWQDRNVLRAAVVHHRTGETDVDALGEALERAVVSVQETGTERTMGANAG